MSFFHSFVRSDTLSFLVTTLTILDKKKTCEYVNNFYIIMFWLIWIICSDSIPALGTKVKWIPCIRIASIVWSLPSHFLPLAIAPNLLTANSIWPHHYLMLLFPCFFPTPLFLHCVKCKFYISSALYFCASFLSLLQLVCSCLNISECQLSKISILSINSRVSWCIISKEQMSHTFRNIAIMWVFQFISYQFVIPNSPSFRCMCFHIADFGLEGQMEPL